MIFRIWQVLLRGAGSIFILLGMFGVFFGILAMIDPAGAKLADDADPRGTPPAFVDSLNLTCFYGLMLLAGGRLVSRKTRSAAADEANSPR